MDETLTCMGYPREHWRNLRTNNPMERMMRGIRRRTRVVGAFPNGNSALMLAAARLRHMASKNWGTPPATAVERTLPAGPAPISPSFCFVRIIGDSPFRPQTQWIK